MLKKTKTNTRRKKTPVFEEKAPLIMEEQQVFVETLETLETPEEILESVEPVKDKKKKFNFTKIIALCLLAVCLIGVYLFIQSRKLSQNSNAQNEKKVKEVVAKVEKLIDLPEDELPSLAVVEDLEMLKDQPFFADARKGDVVLLYGIAQKVFLYNPSDNLIINASSLGVSGQK